MRLGLLVRHQSFVDVDINTWCMNSNALADAITSKTKAVVAYAS